MFKKYNSIENAYHDKYINAIIESGCSDGEFVVMEKVHGANFSFYINDDGIQCAKRTSMLVDGESFFNWPYLCDKLTVQILDMFESTKEIADGRTMVIHGEYFGGVYEHPDVPRMNVSMIQKGIQYSNDHEFYAFDISFLNSDGEHEFIDYDTFVETCEGNILYAKPLFRGTLKECLKQNNEYNSTIPALLGLPDVGVNICEGSVIKPIVTKYLTNGKRVIIKDKNEKWGEKAGLPKRTKVIPKELSEVAIQFYDIASQYIVVNRLKNVLSKIGQVGQKDFGKIKGLLVKDVTEDFVKENEEFKEINKQDKGQVNKEIAYACTLLVRSNFMNIIDGEL